VLASVPRTAHAAPSALAVVVGRVVQGAAGAGIRAAHRSRRPVRLAALAVVVGRVVQGAAGAGIRAAHRSRCPVRSRCSRWSCRPGCCWCWHPCRAPLTLPRPRSLSSLSSSSGALLVLASVPHTAHSAPSALAVVVVVFVRGAAGALAGDGSRSRRGIEGSPRLRWFRRVWASRRRFPRKF
jgi:hypothetical protein